MRFALVPLLLAMILVVAPSAVCANSNQEAAEKIADSIGKQFPQASVDVSYQSGKVWLKGTVASPSERKKVVESVFKVSGIKVAEVNDEIQITASEKNNQAAPTAPAPVKIESKFGRMFFPKPADNRTQQVSAVAPNPQPQAPTPAETMLAPYPQAQYPAAYGQNMPPAGYPIPAGYPVPAGYPAAAQGQPYPQQQYNPQGQGPLPGQYNQPNLPNYAWPAYANYPNYAQVSYPKQYSPKAWPYIGPFYPYPQVPLGWRKVTLESHDGWWWLDFDDNSAGGPFSPLFRQPMRYSY